VSDRSAPQDQGSLVVAWTFNETSNSATCDASNLDAIDIDLADENGNVLSSFSAPCSALSAMVMLEPGNYRATTHFVDVTGARRNRFRCRRKRSSSSRTSA
jgi:hypothetical protein